MKVQPEVHGMQVNLLVVRLTLRALCVARVIIRVESYYQWSGGPPFVARVERARPLMGGVSNRVLTPYKGRVVSLGVRRCRAAPPTPKH